MARARRFVLDAEWLQGGPFEPGSVSVVLTFQVNCPGCFMHALPAMVQLARRDDLRERGLRCAIVATAFEDYEYNTRDNLDMLLKEGKVVGETLRFYRSMPKADEGEERKAASGAGDAGDADSDEPRCPIDFTGLTVGWDAVKPMDEAGRAAMAAKLMEDLRGRAPESVLRAHIDAHVKARTHAATSFDGNNMQGTPTWAVLRGPEMEVLQQMTGHPDPAALVAAIERALR